MVNEIAYAMHYAHFEKNICIHNSVHYSIVVGQYFSVLRTVVQLIQASNRSKMEKY